MPAVANPNERFSIEPTRVHPLYSESEIAKLESLEGELRRFVYQIHHVKSDDTKFENKPLVSFGIILYQNLKPPLGTEVLT